MARRDKGGTSLLLADYENKNAIRVSFNAMIDGLPVQSINISFLENFPGETLIISRRGKN